jgi:hypothetical protein
MRLDLNKCFPESPKDGSQGPLPKQQQFLNLCLDKNGPKYIRYCGGIGSGKTLIGAITVLAWAVTQPGDYLVCRQFLPELKITTLKTFLDVVPPELIEEYRVADGIVRIKAVGGKISNVIFRGLEEPDKHRSLNLSGFWIDESNQVTEAAFLLLQGRLRGPGLRKGILTTNSSGHDWAWRWFVKKDMMKNEAIKGMFVNIYAPSTENTHLPDGYVETMLATWSEERIKREIYADEDTFEGQVYHEFRQDLHVIQPFAIPDGWTRVAGIDHGYRNPAAWVWGAVDFDGNLYIYREFYNREWLIEEICKGKKDGFKLHPGVVDMMKVPGTTPPRYEKLDWAKIDPSTKAQRNEREGRKLSDFDLYAENLPEDFPLQTANNDVTPGIDKVKTYLKPNPKTGKPRLFIFNSCANLIEEIGKYKYPQLTVGQIGKTNEKENPLKVDDHACDALRYLVMGLPDTPITAEDFYEKVKYNSLEGQLHRDLESLRNPVKNGDPFGM